MSTTHDDIDEQHSTRALRRIARRYESAVELARVMVVGLDARGTILLWNREAERVTGFGRDEVLGKPFAAMLSEGPPTGERWDAFGAALSAVASGEAPPEPGAGETTEAAIHTRGGKLRDVRWQLARAPREPSGELAFFAVGRDITDENALAARVRQRERLAAVGTLAAGFAHELRNPLNGARLHLTYLERALRRGTAADALDAVHVVGAEIDRLSSLVTEFLEFARPLPLARRPTSLGALIERVLPLLRPQAEAAKARLACELPTPDPIVNLDPARMEQVLVNLGQNAIEALAPAGGGTVTFRVRSHPRDVSIEVEDDGPGLARRDAPIFDPFYSTKPAGTGLGLPIVHRVVTDHDGSIDVRSAPGRTVFHVKLPITSALPAVEGPR